jgi:hypothetical protein
VNYEREPYDVLYKLSQLKKCLKDDIEVAVFRDNGWGDDPSSKSVYTIIIDGNGQIDYGKLSKECFDLLRKDGYLEHNTLGTNKDRGYHKYLGPIGIGYCGWKYAPLSEAGGKGE